MDDLTAAPETVVVPRPHFSLRGSQIFFLASKRPYCELSSAEIGVWKAVDSEPTLASLRERFAGVDATVAEFNRRGLCELVETPFPAGRRRILVIEPHADDAALSLAGTMWLRRRECEFTVATVASRSNYTSYYDLARDFFDVEHVSRLRSDESELFARMLGGRHIDLGRTDAALRYRESPWSLDYFRGNRVAISAATSRIAEHEERAGATLAIQALLAATPCEEVWIPLGAPHADHLLTTQACLAALVATPSLVAGRVVKVYQDVPYAARTPHFSGEMLEAFAQAGVLLEAETVPIADAWEQKLRLVSIYASQFKIESMRDDIAASALRPGSGDVPIERLWAVRGMPDKIVDGGLAPESRQRHEQERMAGAWLKKHGKARRVRILLLLPTGRWAHDLARLRAAMPDARFEVIAASAASAEVAECMSPGVDVREVAGGMRAWTQLALQLAVAKPMPTVFHAGEKRLTHAGWMARLWPLSDTLVVGSMDRLMRALDRRSSEPTSAAGRPPT